MDENEIRSTLLSICVILKAQTEYYADLHLSMMALSKAVMSENPDLQRIYHEHWKTLTAANPLAFGNNNVELIRTLDELIVKLKA